MNKLHVKVDLPLMEIMTVILFTLRLCKVIDWPWYLLCAPIYVELVMSGIFYALYWLITHRRR